MSDGHSRGEERRGGGRRMEGRCDILSKRPILLLLLLLLLVSW